MGYKSERWGCRPVGWLWCLGLVGTVIGSVVVCVCVFVVFVVLFKVVSWSHFGSVSW